ncbi:MAG: CPBP family intramembrane glutamic endopeptidase [Rhodothermales bacterium]
MLDRLRNEGRLLVSTVRGLDRQTLFVLTAAAVLMVTQFVFGSRTLFRQDIAPHFFPETWHQLAGWGWWFSMQGITGFVLPVVFLRVLFRQSATDMGLGLGDWRLASTLALLYLPFVVIGTWILSNDPAFIRSYPHYQPAAFNWVEFFIYEILFLFYWFGWEYLWRGFILFGTRHTLGLYAILVQTIPFAALHVTKPTAEAYLSILGGIALGALVWRCRSFWIAVPIHAVQMFVLDFWCTLRARTGVSGIGLEALRNLFATWLGG